MFAIRIKYKYLMCVSEFPPFLELLGFYVHVELYTKLKIFVPNSFATGEGLLGKVETAS